MNTFMRLPKIYRRELIDVTRATLLSHRKSVEKSLAQRQPPRYPKDPSQSARHSEITRAAINQSPTGPFLAEIRD